MAHHVPTRLTPQEGRRFALTVGIAFLALAAISRWRGHDVVPWVLAGVGAGLALAGIVIPGLLGPVYRGWMAFGLLLSKVTTPIFMSLLYFVAITPLGLVMRVFGRNPLNSTAHKKSFWVQHESSSNKSMTRQF
ncbi:MAG: SxtJ family membrane protein [Gemmatimonadaceae bacterium]